MVLLAIMCQIYIQWNLTPFHEGKLELCCFLNSPKHLRHIYCTRTLQLISEQTAKFAQLPEKQQELFYEMMVRCDSLDN